MNDYSNFDSTVGSDLSAGLHTSQCSMQEFNDKILPNEMVLAAVTNACEFFGLPEVPVVNAQGTCMWPNDSSTCDDDVLGFNRAQLISLGISGEDSLTLVYTHECAHRTLQGAYNDAWEEELACDFFAGVHAGMKGININNYEASLGQISGSASHPHGALRADFIEYGERVAQEMKDRGVEITYENCIQHLNQHLIEKDGLIAEYRDRIDDGSIGLTDNESVHIEGEAKGLFVDDRAYHLREAQTAKENAEWHHKRANEAIDRGDLSAARDHNSRAEIYQREYKEHLNSASKCSK